MKYIGELIGKLLSIIAFSALLLITPPSVGAWYGAGITPGWDNAYDGLTGMVTNSVSAPAASYTINTSIPLNFRITNPSGNATISEKPIYLKIFRVLHSPLSQNLGNPATVDGISMTEDSLFANNNNGDDAQMSHQTLSLGTLNLFGGQSQDFSTSISIATPGYYQYDLTDLPPESAFVPGHIYAAGFLRVVNPPPGGPGGGGGGGGGSVQGASAPVCTDQAPGGAPTLLSITGGTNTVTLTWSPAPNPVDYYLVAYGTSPGVYQFGNPNVGGPGTTSYTVSNLSGGVTYYFAVRAGNGCAPGPFSNELTVNPGGGVVEGPATGFEEGVLGEATESAALETPPEAGGVVEGAEDSVPGCATCLWWPFLLLAVVLTLLYHYLAMPRWTQNRRLVIGFLIPVAVFIVFLLWNRNCLGAMDVFFFLKSPSWFCRYFILVAGIVYLITSTGFNVLYQREKASK